LRVGVMQARRIVEERVLEHARWVSIGSAPTSTFIVPSEHVPARWRLFDRGRAGWVLCLGAGMVAQVAAEGGVATFRGGEGPSVPQRVPLPDGARGKVTFGETTVLFQLVRPPSVAPRPRLPVSVRRRTIADVDTLFAAVLAVVLALHVAVVVYLRQVDWPRRPALDEVPDRFVRQWLQRPRPRAAPPEPAARAETPPRDRRPAPAPPSRHPRIAVQPAPAPAPRSAQDRGAALRDAVNNLGVLPLIIGKGDGPSPAIADLLASGAVDRPVEEALRGVTDIQVAGDESLAHLRVQSGPGKIAVPPGLRGGARVSAPAETGAVAERRVRVTLVGAPEVEGGRVDPQRIAREIRERRAAIASCYERALKQQPTLAGKLVVRFTIAPAGTVIGLELDEDTLGAPAVAACVRATIARWRFATVGDGPVEVSFPFVFQAGD